MPYIPSSDSRERAREYFDAHPAIHAVALGTFGAAFGLLAIYLFNGDPTRYVFPRWGSVLLAVIYLSMCLHRTVTLLVQRTK